MKCGSARPHTRSRPERAARCACPVPVRGESERALARRAAAGQLRSPGLTCSRVAEYVVDPSAGGKQAGGTQWAGERREERRRGTVPSYQGGDQSWTTVAGRRRFSRSALTGLTSSQETLVEVRPRARFDAPGARLKPTVLGSKLGTLNDWPAFSLLSPAFPSFTLVSFLFFVCSTHTVNWWHPRAI